MFFIFLLLILYILFYNNVSIYYISTIILLKIYKNLYKPKDFKVDLKNVKDIYRIFHFFNGKLYIGSSLDFYSRLCDHLKENNSNNILQCSIDKYGLIKFIFIIFLFS